MTCGDEEEEEGGGSNKMPLCIRWIVLYKLVKRKKKASRTSGSSWALMLTGPDFLTGPRTMKRTSVKPSESISKRKEGEKSPSGREQTGNRWRRR